MTLESCFAAIGVALVMATPHGTQAADTDRALRWATCIAEFDAIALMRSMDRRPEHMITWDEWFEVPTGLSYGIDWLTARHEAMVALAELAGADGLEVVSEVQLSHFSELLLMLDDELNSGGDTGEITRHAGQCYGLYTELKDEGLMSR